MQQQTLATKWCTSLVCGVTGVSLYFASHDGLFEILNLLMRFNGFKVTSKSQSAFNIAMISSGGKVDSAVLSKVFGSLEEREQKLIQTLRTSGLRKATETSMIDTLLDVRRERRRILSDLMLVCDRQRAQNAELDKQLEAVKADHKQHVKDMIATMESDERKAAHDTEVSLLALKKAHERKLKELSLKLSQVTSARSVQEEASIAAAAKQITQRELAKQRELYEAKMLRYKQALRDIIEREKHMEAAVAQQQRSASLAENTSVRLQAQMQAQKESNQELVQTLTNVQNSLDACEMQLQDERTLCNTLRLESQRKDELLLHNSRHATDRHSQEMAAVDDKVRQALLRKDERIEQLERANFELLQAQNELRSDLQSVFR